MGQQASDNDHAVVHRTVIQYPRTGDRRSGAARFVQENASACVTACFNELIPNVEDTCRQLQQPEYQQTRLWDLYCCDSISCGVYIGDIGQSPNVDLIINECQNIGFFSIKDPGPPASNYCAFPTPNTIATGAPPHATADEPQTLPIPRIWSTESIGPYNIPPTNALDTSMLFASTSVLTSSSSSTSSPISTDTTSPRLTEGAKAAISIFSVIAVLAITAIIFLLIHRRQRRLRSSSPEPRLITFVNRPYPIPNSDSGTPLITPPPSASSRSAPLTPPAKLSERKYLEPSPKPGTPRLPASPAVADQTFPSTPIGTPTQNRPIHLRSETTNNIGSPAARVASVPSHHPQSSSVYSMGSGPGGSTATVESNKVNSVHSASVTVTGASTPPLSAMRFPRAHDGPHESSDFVTPAGPPPNRALPAPPPNHPNSPTFSVASVSPRSPTFPARCLTRGDNPVVPPQQGSTSRPPASISAKELRDLTESYARETRESWGSWSGVGGGGPGVTSAGRKRGSAEKKGDTKTAVPLQELDLEKLSGRY
ncbi:hypothetical protein F4859DRAFT_99759 [Xylaria cf. heliscus]|nr:hypothetical protein F4859DRAFT_99759 [Xylaria cf. heliscus]